MFLSANTPYPDVVSRFRHERGVNQSRLLMSYTCAYGETCGNHLPKPLVSRLREVGNYPATDFRYIPPGDGLRGLVFRTGTGDTPHAETPIFLVSQGGQTLRRIKLNHRDQIGLGRNGQYLLLADEYSGDNPVLIDLETGNTVFSVRARAAVWVP